nr:hypothetical protein [Azospirillum baldaniorum]
MTTPKLAAAAADGPEEVGVLVGAGAQELPVCGDHVGGQQIVHRQPVFAGQPAEPAAQRQPGDAGGRVDADRHGQPESLGLPVQVAQRGAGGHPRGPADGVDMDEAQGAEVDQQPPIAQGIAGDVVTAAAHGDQQPVLPREAHRLHDVRGTGAAGDQAGPAVDHGVPDRPGFVIARRLRGQQRAAQTGGKIVDGVLGKSRVPPVGGAKREIAHQAPPTSKQQFSRISGADWRNKGKVSPLHRPSGKGLHPVFFRTEPPLNSVFARLRRWRVVDQPPWLRIQAAVALSMVFLWLMNHSGTTSVR